MAETLLRRAPAKINLTLRVSPLRPDGYHDIESLVALIPLHDELRFTATDDDAVTLTCSDAQLATDEQNLVIRAALALRRHTGCMRGVRIDLQKQIPAGAGLGGGSSDAASTLLALRELWSLDIALADLVNLGATLGSDVPLFFCGPLSIIRGRGEQVTALDQRLHGWIALVLPPLHCETRRVYDAFDRQLRPPAQPALAELLKTATGNPISAATLQPHFFNDLLPAALEVCPSLGPLLEIGRQLTDQPMHLTGSGAAFFAIFDTQDSAQQFQSRFQTQAPTCRVLVLAFHESQMI